MNRSQLALVLIVSSAGCTLVARSHRDDDAPANESAWATAPDGAGRFSFQVDGKPAVLHGVSMTGLETGTRETASGAGFWLFQSGAQGAGIEAANAPTVLSNVARALTTAWRSNIVRIPICGSAWAQNYGVHDWNGGKIAGYRDWVDDAVKAARASGAVVIIDNHLWAIGKRGAGRGTFTSNGKTQSYGDFEDGATGTSKSGDKDSTAPSDWFTGDPATWECPISNADGVSMHNAYANKDKIAPMWADVAARYKGDSGVWFEVYNEPYARTASGANLDDADYPWDLWSAFMHQQIRAIRDGAGASNVIIVNGLDFGYDFGPDHGPIAFPDRYLPWNGKYANVAYGFHPYQHGACCGNVGADSDESVTDPYESAFCSYYPDGTQWGAPSGAKLPSGTSCTNNGYASTQDKKMPPCTWVPGAWNPTTRTTSGLCAGERGVCNAKGQAECEGVDWASPSAGGWSKHVLPMAKFGPLIATEFGSFDCSSPYLKTLLAYMAQFGISYTAWGLWSQNSGGPDGLGACGYPSVMQPVSAPGDFHECLDPAACAALVQPLAWSGTTTFQALMGSVTPVKGQASWQRSIADSIGIAAGMGSTPADQRALLADIRGLGIHRARVDFTWNDIERTPMQGRWDTWSWGTYDSFVSLADAAPKVDILGILDYGAKWANHAAYGSGGDDMAPPDKLSDFTDFAKAVVHRYNESIHAYEIWNEPNNGHNFWHSASKGGAAPGVDYAPRATNTGNFGDPGLYAHLTVATMNAIHGMNLGPKTPQLAPGGSIFLWTPINSSSNDFMKAAFEAEPHLGGLTDAETLHGYSTYPPVNPPEADGTTWNFQTDVQLGAKVSQTNAVYRAAGFSPSKPVWLTEIGWPTGTFGDQIGFGHATVDEGQQARWTIRAIVLGILNGADLVYLYDMVDGTKRDDPESNFGLKHSDRSPKQAYTAVAHLTSKLGAYRIVGRVKVNDPKNSVYVVRLVDPSGKQAWIVWDSIEAGSGFTWPMPAGTTCSGILGGGCATKNGAVLVNSTPVYVAE